MLAPTQCLLHQWLTLPARCCSAPTAAGAWSSNSGMPWPAAKSGFPAKAHGGQTKGLHHFWFYAMGSTWNHNWCHESVMNHALPLTRTVPEAATLLGIGRNAAYEAVRNGEIPAIRIGKRWLVPVAALERLLQAQEPPEARPPDQATVSKATIASRRRSSRPKVRAPHAVRPAPESVPPAPTHSATPQPAQGPSPEAQAAGSTPRALSALTESEGGFQG